MLLMTCVMCPAVELESVLPTASLKTLQKMRAKKLVKTSYQGSIKIDGVKDTALMLGAQTALFQYSERINQFLELHAHLLDQIFNFQAFISSQNILLPAVVVAHDHITVQKDSMKTIQNLYQIDEQAHFVTSIPTWRDFLTMHYKPLHFISDAFLPTKSTERLVWKKYVAIGWKNGEDQAQAIFREQLSALQRAYLGRILYLSLLTKQMITEPMTANAYLGISAEADSIQINEKLQRIIRFPSLNIDSKYWKPILHIQDPHAISK